jgi:hypothetical protein
MSPLVAMAPCFVCHNPFLFDPALVPVAVVNGAREILCRDCVQQINPLRAMHGLALIELLPGAYLEDLDEE